MRAPVHFIRWLDHLNLAIGLRQTANDYKMGVTRQWPKKSPILATCSRREQAKHKTFPKPNGGSTELICIYTLDDEGCFILL